MLVNTRALSVIRRIPINLPLITNHSRETATRWRVRRESGWSAGSPFVDIKIVDSLGTHACNRCKEHEILTGRSRDIFRWSPVRLSVRSTVRSLGSSSVCPSVSPSGCHHQFCTLASVKTLTLLLLRGRPRYKFRWTMSRPLERKSHSYLFV